MKISIKELRRYVDIFDLSPEVIANKLTFAGIEVESIDKMASGTNLIIGQVLECSKHPDSDHLHVCKVDLGPKYGITQIVCGAPNVRKDLKVIVARVGAKLPEIEIKAGNIRGQESNGMLCSLCELGVDKKYLTEAQINGINECDDSSEVGSENVLEVLGIDDTVLDLKPLANRPDANSIICVAKEVAALFERKFYDIEIKNTLEINDLSLEVKSECAECPKFTAVVVDGVEVKPSPRWLVSVLNASGVRSINNIVDIGNFVMLLLAQPLHMYDYDKLAKKELVAKTGFNEEFVALDNSKYQVTENDICITSDGRIECLAGVMGSLESETTGNTKTVVVEAAVFDQKSIRLTSNRLGLASDSSILFTKGINKNIQEKALKLTISLLKDLANAKTASPIHEIDNINWTNTVVRCTYSYINNRLGTNFSNELIKFTLNKLNIKTVDVENDTFDAIIPDYRIDIVEKADLSEEVIRVLGYDQITSVLPTTIVSIGGKSEINTKKDIITDYLVNNGYYQILTYSLTSLDKCSEFNILDKGTPVALLNPLIDERKYLRRSLIPSMLEVLSYNLKRKVKDLKMFEISNIYTEGTCSSHLCVGVSGNEVYQAQLKKEPFTFYTLKGVFESICKMFGIEHMRYKLEKIEDNNQEFHIGKTAYIKIGKKIVGVIGDLHPYVYKEYDLGKSSTIIMELQLDDLLSMKTSAIKQKEWSRFQPVNRDIAFIIKDKYTYEEISNEIRKVCGNLASNIEIFDIYEGTNIEKGYKSVAITVAFLSQIETLKEEQINSKVDAMINALKIKFDIKQRI